MKLRQLAIPVFAAVLLVGLVAAGVSVGTAVVAVVALACPLMLVFMMGGIHPDSRDRPTTGGGNSHPVSINERDGASR